MQYKRRLRVNPYLWDFLWNLQGLIIYKETTLVKLLMLIVCYFVCLLACRDAASANKSSVGMKQEIVHVATFDSNIQTIHVFVALCDNKYQGIIPVPARIGNGQDLNHNLYWGCSGGIRSYFQNSKDWILQKRYFLDSIRLERIVFKNRSENCYLVADAYNGRYIRNCTVDFLRSASGQQKDTIQLNGKVLGINGNSKALAYIGHDGLMDFRLDEKFINTDSKTRDVFILACISKRFFSRYVINAKANPLLWSTGLMAPEAYTLHDALEGYVKKESPENIRSRAAKAYSRYQKCGEKAARNLLVSGY